VYRVDVLAWRTWLPRVRKFGRTFLAESKDDRLFGLAAETAFFTVLGVFPGLLLAAGLLGVLGFFVGAGVAQRAQSTVVDALNLVLTDQASGVVASVAGLFETSRGQLLTFAALGALVTISGAFAVVIEALNLAYDTIERRSWIRRRLLGLVMGIATLIVAVLAVVVLVVGPFFGRGDDLASLVGLGAAFSFTWSVLRLPLLLFGLVLWAMALFHLAPNRDTRWRDAVPGALVTAVLWIVVTGGFHLYLVIVASTNPLLGAFGGGAILMIWIYLLSLALLLGGELNATLARRKESGGAGSDLGLTRRDVTGRRPRWSGRYSIQN